MKGLILKDFYMLSKYLRMFLLLIVAFTIYSVFDRENFFYQIYPAMLVGAMPMTLYSYDEREHWCSYSQTLPVSKRQYVTAKYAVGLINVSVFAVFAAVVQLMAHGGASGFVWEDYLAGLLLLVIFGLTAQAFTLPFLIKFGVEKGRIIFIMLFVLLGVAIGILTELQKLHFENIQGLPFVAVGCLVIIAAYIISWFLSVKFYEKREM